MSLRDISPNRGIYPEGKARITGKFFPVLRGKWRKVPKGGRPPPRRKVGFERSEKTDEEPYFKTRRLIHR